MTVQTANHFTGNPQVMAIVGPGRLGCAMARWAAQHGFTVKVVGRGGQHVWESVGHLLESGTAIYLFDDLKDALADADIVFEALPEDLAQKAKIWPSIQEQSSPDALLLTGTSSLSLASIRLAADLSRQLIGFHLFLPIDRMKAVEIVSEPGTSENTLAPALKLAAQLEKIPVQVNDQPGFAASRMALAMGLEAMRLVESGAADAASVDLLMKYGYGHPCGPLELSDRIGLGLRLTIARQLFRETGDVAFKPPAILESKVANGELGRASGLGFYTWDNGAIKRNDYPNRS
jgi:3-hydroxybutyryl-CoA dehydrogenase